MQIRPTGPCPAKIMIVGEAPGEREVAEGQPFVGFSGQEMSKMLQEAGIMRSECFITNVVRVRPPGNDINAFIAQRKSDISAQHIMLRDKFVLPAVRDGFELLKREIEMCQPNVIIAFGNVALWALTGQWGITSWRRRLNFLPASRARARNRLLRRKLALEAEWACTAATRPVSSSAQKRSSARTSAASLAGALPST